MVDLGLKYTRINIIPGAWLAPRNMVETKTDFTVVK